MIEKSSLCTACGACVQKCPRQCITLYKDENGFLYPKIQLEECVNCGLCERICPIGDCSQSISSKPDLYACTNKDNSMLLQETSGGVFGVIATHVLDMGGIVYGCAYVGHLQATHVRVDNKNLLPSLFGSKYVQSNTCNTFKECEKDLKNGKYVLYSGTPCQIAGLRKYLQKEYFNLLTIDIICHGVASQSYFDKFIAFLEERNQAVCIDYNFRSKENSGWSCAGIARFKRKNGETFNKKQFYFSNYYYYYYLSCAIYRESCYTCQYTNLNRVGDFTLGDCWGAEGQKFDFDITDGCSIVLLNTEKAKNVFKELNIYSANINTTFALVNNAQLREPSRYTKLREVFLREYPECSAEEIQKRFKQRFRIARIKARIKYFVPEKIKKILLKYRYSLK